MSLIPFSPMSPVSDLFSSCFLCKDLGGVEIRIVGNIPPVYESVSCVDSGSHYPQVT